MTGVDANGACASPTATARPSSVAPGGDLELTIENLLAECADEGSPVAPRDLPLEWRQGDEEIQLATVRSNDGTKFTIQVSAPSTAVAGPATIEIGELLTVEITVEEPS